MTELAQRLTPVAWEDAAATVLSVAGSTLRHLLLGVSLGLTGLAVVLAFTALLIGVHELTAAGLPSLLPPQIRFQ